METFSSQLSSTVRVFVSGCFVLRACLRSPIVEFVPSAIPSCGSATALSQIKVRGAEK
jgi:hypothetical protein